MRRDTDQTRLGRRGFLRRSALIAGTALASSGLARAAAGAPLEVPPTAKEPGRGIAETSYGVSDRRLLALRTIPTEKLEHPGNGSPLSIAELLRAPKDASMLLTRALTDDH
jgi:hypothetical protein